MVHVYAKVNQFGEARFQRSPSAEAVVQPSCEWCTALNRISARDETSSFDDHATFRVILRAINAYDVVPLIAYPLLLRTVMHVCKVSCMFTSRFI